jgi:N-methylhydantoinase A
MALDREAAITALKTVGDQLGLDPIAMAEGICDVANSQMAQAIRTTTISLRPSLLAGDDPLRVLHSQT